MPLRSYLKGLGYHVEGWGLGRNLAGVNLEHTLEDLSDGWEISEREEYHGEGSVPHLCDRFTDQVQARHDTLGRPITLIGWSLGGCIVREAARDVPAVVDREVSMETTVGNCLLIPMR